MKTKIACVSCGDFFEPDMKEVRRFVALNADRAYLRRIPFTKDMRAQFSNRDEYVAFLLMAYCPYCREVKFGCLVTTEYPRGGLTEEKYLKDLEAESERRGGFSIREIPDTYPVIADDED